MQRSFWRRHRRLILIAGIPLALLLLAFVPSPRASVGMWFYELLRRAPDPRPDLQTGAPFLVIGHRGAAGYAVENTIPSFERALTVDSATAVETDLCMTADSAIILWHDWDPDGVQSKIRERGGEPDVLCRPHFPDDDSPMRRPVHQLPRETFIRHYGYESGEEGKMVRGTIPTLDEFMAWGVGKERLRCVFLDIKIPEEDSALAPAMMTLVDRTVKKYGPSFRIIYLTPHQSIYRAIRRTLPDATLSFDAEPPPGVVLDPCDQSSVRYAMANHQRAASIIHPYTSTVAPWTSSRRIVECDLEMRKQHNASKQGIPIDMVISSTMNDESKLEWLVGLGLDGVITDYPDRLRAIARRMGRRVE